MDTKPIQTEADYEIALKEIEQLFDSEPGTLAGDRLEVLVTLVSAYENTHYPIPNPDQIEFLHYFRESRGVDNES